jgi:hypothetical protein
MIINCKRIPGLRYFPDLRLWESLIFLLPLALSSLISFSQTDTSGTINFQSVNQTLIHNNHIGIEAGFPYIFNLDPLGSPLYYHHMSLEPGIVFEHHGKKSWQYANVNFIITRLRSKISGDLGEDSHTVQFISFNTHYKYLHLITKLVNNKLNFFGGAGIDMIFSLRNYNYGRGIEEETIAEPFTTLNFAGKLEYDISNRVEIGFNSSFGGPLNFSFRNPYSVATTKIASVATHRSLIGAYLELGEFASINKLVYSENEIYLSLPLSKRWLLNLKYDLIYYSFYHPRKSQTFINNISGLVLFKF